MSCTRLYVECKYALMFQARKKEGSKPSNGLVREHKGEQFIKYHRQHKGYQASINRAIFLSYGHFSALFTGFSSLKFPHPVVSPCSPDNNFPLSIRSQKHSSALFRVFIVQVPPHPGLLKNIPFCLCIIITMIQ